MMTPGEFFTIYCCWTTYDDSESIQSTRKIGRALPPGRGHGRPPWGRARRSSRGRAGGAAWRATDEAREPGAWVAAAEDLV